MPLYAANYFIELKHKTFFNTGPKKHTAPEKKKLTTIFRPVIYVIRVPDKLVYSF